MFKTKKIVSSSKPSSAKGGEARRVKKEVKKPLADKYAKPSTPKVSVLRSGALKSGAPKSVAPNEKGPKTLPGTPASRSLARMAAKVGIKPGASKTKVKVTQLGKRGATPSMKLKAPVVKVAAPAAQLRADEPAMKAAQAAVDKKAFDVVVLDVAEISGLCDRMILCSARSSTHLGAVADGVEEALRKAGQRLLHSDGRRTAEPEWVLLDYGDLMVHIFRAQARVDYQLEEYYSAGKVLARFEND